APSSQTVAVLVRIVSHLSAVWLPNRIGIGRAPRRLHRRQPALAGGRARRALLACPQARHLGDFGPDDPAVRDVLFLPGAQAAPTQPVIQRHWGHLQMVGEIDQPPLVDTRTIRHGW
ncbi:MAG TPA: hypothetical protein VFE42_24710, partial [Chloroflexota bacterium]|nr:hypothetical protein [Chloroflexota bacterium]